VRREILPRARLRAAPRAGLHAAPGAGLYAACLGIVLAASPLWSQDVATLPEVVVTATRVDTGIAEAPSSVTVVSQSQIEQSGATDVGQLLNGQPDVVVNDYGTRGSVQTVSIRGSTSDQAVVLLDGVRLNSSRDGSVNLSSIPLEAVDHIEIVRGVDSSLYGSGAIGGVINIITRTAEKPSASVSLTNGSFLPHAASMVAPDLSLSPVAANPLDLVDSQNVSVSLAGKLGPLGVVGGGSFLRAANGYTWDDAIGIDGWRRRTNADTLSGSGYVGLTASVLGGDLSAKGIYDSSDTGAPGSLTFVSDSARQTDSSLSGSLSWKTDRFLTDALSLDVKGFYRADTLGYTDPSFPPPSLHQTQTASLDVTQRLSISDAVAMVYGGSGSYDYAQSTNFTSVKDRLDLAGFLSLPFSPLPALTFTPTARYDYYSDFPGSLSYSLGAVLRLSEQSSVRASAGSAYRVPTMNELYWSDPYDIGNPGLRPETSYNGEIGWILDTRRVSVNASVFVRLMLDEISAIWPYDPASGLFMPVNISQSLLPGVEIEGTIALTDQLALQANYTFLYSYLLQYAGQTFSLSNDLRVPFVPVHNLSAGISYTGRGISVSADIQYVSQKYTDFANTPSLALPGYLLVNAGLTFSMGSHLVLALSAKNLLDAVYYTQAGYPMPPFSVETGVTAKL